MNLMSKECILLLQLHITVSCRCCKDNPTAKIPAEVMNEINQGLNKKGMSSRTVSYWICRLRRGAFPNKAQDVNNEKRTLSTNTKTRTFQA